MGRLVRLYPSAWRDRYEAEFLDLLAERPPTLRDRLDIVRGAFDARLHPQVVASADREPPADRRPALAAVASGLCWIAAAASLGLQGSPWPYREGMPAMFLSGTAILLFAGAAFAAADPMSGRIVRRLAVVIGVAGVLMFLGWPAILLGYFGFLIAALAIGAAGPRAGLWPAWASGALILALLPALWFNTEDDRAWLIVPLGVAVLVLGFVLLGRGPRRIAV